MGARTQRIGPSYSREYVQVQADLLEQQLDDAYGKLQDDKERAAAESTRTAIRGYLAAARKATELKARLSWTGRLRDAWSGALVEGAFLRLHAAEVILLDLLPNEEAEIRVRNAFTLLRNGLDDDRRLAMVKAQLRSIGVDVSPEDDADSWERTIRRMGALGAGGANPGTASTGGGAARQAVFRAMGALGAGGANPTTASTGGGAARQAVFRSVIRLAYEVLDLWYARVRSFRNAVIMASILLAVLVGGVVFIGARAPAAIPLCFQPASGGATCPSGGNQPSSGDVAVVAFLGLVGGGLAGALTVRNLLKTRTPNAMPIAPHTVPIALSVLKLPAGALTAIGGLLLVSGGFVPGLTALDTQGQILAYAFVLGFAQQIATSQIDKQARQILGAQPRDDGQFRRRQVTTPPRPFLDA